ncbi:MBL fold metallo-hydrolase [Daejeonella sp. H1SJ63]|jgi:phosphoribosyl 1,2-cyclic phosphodiesterase|uniref:MBL fold metallo-hydrolase n=1 Tax=Daejeonella sp. H1SJ63 TaxID=3034145 RepID=UPI0023EBF9D2|nr:MBL fold metallo-hydrolase [Daejeonella sp. H1SJ63]
MALSFASLNSGSNGNCYYLANEKDAIFVDAGLSCKETERRMARMGLSMEKVRAIFVSHEHSDHIRGIPVLSKKYRLPVYITQRTLKSTGFELDEQLVRHFNANEEILIGELSVLGFPKFHDAADPHSFTVSCRGVRVGVFTDIGTPCDHLIHHLSGCHAAFLEANYDEDMLDKGTYPYHLKARIRGGNGHLSNRQAFEIFQEMGTQMSHLLLSHLSRDNNKPELVLDLFGEIAGNTEIVVASRYCESKVYHIGKNDKKLMSGMMRPVQYSLFD